MTDKSGRRYPLPPRKDKNAPKGKQVRRRPLHRRAFRAVATAPGKLMQRVNQELYRRNAELAARNKTLALLRKLDEISLSALDMQQIAQSMTRAIAQELGYDLVTIAKLEGSQLRWLALSSSVPWMDKVLSGAAPAPLTVSLAHDSPLARASAGREPQYIEDSAQIYPAALMSSLRAADNTPHVPELQHSVVFPMRVSNVVFGLLTLSASRPLATASQYERESVAGIVGLVALAMYKAQIYQDLQVATGQLAQANQRLKDSDKAKSEFLNIASHQLYTPLTALRGYLSMLKEGDFGALPEKQAPVLDILQQSANRLITLIKNLLDISRIEAGRLELKLESINLVELAKQLVQELMPNAITKKLDLEFHSPASAVPHVVADRDRLRQVLLNIIDNAIKYTEQGRVDVRVSHHGDAVTCSVADSGKGLTPAEIGVLFTKFTRVGGSSRLHTEGSGLGLYVARQIVREHRGEIKVESPGLGQGSTFLVVLPVEGSPGSLKAGQKASVEIKAAESDSHASAQS